MKSKFKRAVIIAMAVIIAIGACACAVKSNPNTTEKAIASIQYL